MDDLIVEFLTETNESLEELDQDLVNLEQNPNDKDLLGKIFRVMHTIKGTCGFLDLPRLEKVAHHAENVLGRFRDGDLDVTPEYVSLIFESLDVIKDIVKDIEQTGKEPEAEYPDLIAKLDAAYEGQSLSTVSHQESGISEDIAKDTQESDSGRVSEPDEHGFVPVPAAGAVFNDNETPAEKAPPAEQVEEPEAQPSQDNADKTEDKEDKDEAGAKKASGTPLSAQTLRVNVDVLENLMTMVSELVLNRNQLLQISRNSKDNQFEGPLQQLNHVVSDLQDGVMKTRMQPIGNAWSKLPRIIRDLSIELDKKVNLEMRGQDTELDRQVLEMIKDPLTHMVRNSVDHGIETVEERLKAGKPEEGRVLLNAYHEGGHIIIRISDDGKGLSTDKIKQKVLDKGLATEDHLAEMSDQQIQQFIFKAGFSTAEQVTAVSGRGVGMDVVRTNIEKIGGSIELKSTEGKGSVFTIKIPLTLAIVSALIVASGEERFAIPQLAVQELVMVSSSGNNAIEMIKGTPVFRLRDRLLPLVSLAELLGIKKDKDIISEDLADGRKDDDGDSEGSAAMTEDEKTVEKLQDNNNQYIVVTKVGSYTFGIIVDRVFDTEEIVVKPVSKILRQIDLFSGNTILGDGSVIMILDPNGIAQHTGEVEAGDEEQQQQEDSLKRAAELDQKTSLLLFKAGDKTPKAVPLSLIARLENIEVKDIEYSGTDMMVQYRGALMPLIPYSDGIVIEGAEHKPVLVFADDKRAMGIIIDEIIDIKDEVVKVNETQKRTRVLGSAIIDGKATDVVDVAYFLNRGSDNWFKTHDDTPYNKEGAKAAKTQKRRVLLVDDSHFFRNMIIPLLKMAGYDVEAAESAQDALRLCESGDQFDLIISDIEMPDMDGFEFAKKIKTSSNWQDTPMLALSSHATPQDIDRGLQVGFQSYVAKFDRDTLLSTISETLADDQIAAE